MKDQTKVLGCALPLYLQGNNGKAVLIVHGYTGYPGEYYGLAHALHQEGYTVHLPRLPGHGTNRSDFLNTGWRDWLNHIQNAYLDLQAAHESVAIAGLSMGGVIALILGARFNPDKLVLMAPAIVLQGSIAHTPLLKFFIKTKPKQWIPQESDSEEIRFLGREYWSVYFIKQLANLYTLIKMAKKGLSEIQSPALLFLSEKDDAVSLKTGDLLESEMKNCKLDKIILKNSPHVILSGQEKGYILSEITAWLKKENK